jgi:hypothetical protein
MKTARKILLGSLILAGLQFGLSSCVLNRSTGTGVYYGPERDAWFQDDLWMDGHRWYADPRGTAEIGVYLYPPRQAR